MQPEYRHRYWPSLIPLARSTHSRCACRRYSDGLIMFHILLLGGANNFKSHVIGMLKTQTWGCFLNLLKIDLLRFFIVMFMDNILFSSLTMFKCWWKIFSFNEVIFHSKLITIFFVSLRMVACNTFTLYLDTFYLKLNIWIHLRLLVV